MNESVFVRNVAERLDGQQCDLFIGSGISVESNFPNWKNLLVEALRDIGINIREDDDLPLLAQYVVNENAGNPNNLRRMLADAFSCARLPNEYHEILKNYCVATIWTTNYDGLLEKAFSHKNPKVIVEDIELLERGTQKRLQIIKLHGSIDRGPDSLVLTQSDYDGVLFTRPAMFNSLKGALLKRSILFLGYGYRDANIRTVMIEAQQLMKRNTLDHYMILKTPNGSASTTAGDRDLETRFLCWLKELNRIGINTLAVNSWEDYKRVLRLINLKSKRKRVFATGSHNSSGLSLPLILGKELSRRGYNLVYGQSEGIGHSVYQGFVQNAITEKRELNDSVDVFANPYSASTEYDDCDEYLPLLRRERQKLIERVGAVLIYAGGKGTRTELEVAIESNCAILPCIVDPYDLNNPVIKQCLQIDRILRPLEKVAPAYLEKITDSQVPTVDEVLVALERLLENA